MASAPFARDVDRWYRHYRRLIHKRAKAGYTFQVVGSLTANTVDRKQG